MEMLSHRLPLHILIVRNLEILENVCVTEPLLIKFQTKSMAQYLDIADKLFYSRKERFYGTFLEDLKKIGSTVSAEILHKGDDKVCMSEYISFQNQTPGITLAYDMVLGADVYTLFKDHHHI